MRETLLFISTNNGSDARTSKELYTLSSRFDILFYGFLKEGETPGAALSVCKRVYLAPGTARSFRSLSKYLFRVSKDLIFSKKPPIHVVNEELLILLFPFLAGKRVTLDIFDSLFLKKNKPGQKAFLAKRILYGLPKFIIVTDHNRKELLPSFARKKAVVIPNVPNLRSYPPKEVRSDGGLTVYYVGSLEEARGSSFLSKLLLADERVSVISAGWICDAPTKELTDHPRVEYLGVLPQDEVNMQISARADYLLAIYPLNNDNNRNASPNKVFDALHTKTPLITTAGTHAASLVEELDLGILVPEESSINFKELSLELFRRRGCFEFDESSLKEYSWQRYEGALISCHRTL